MVIVTEMDSGRRVVEDRFGAYGDEVLNAGWTAVPPIESRCEPRLEEVVVARHGSSSCEPEGFLARVYAAQE